MSAPATCPRCGAETSEPERGGATSGIGFCASCKAWVAALMKNGRVDG